jgi:Zn-dependent M16 (insulinase) family peptidase
LGVLDFEQGKVYHGFKLLEEQKIEELNSIGKVFYHEKSGARLFSLANDDDNKVFFIGFRTPPEDDTGLPHILEHSVLCGSRKFPTKEPFVELAKGSLNTFLNAMTYPDKTLYPVASRNIKDLYNLMDVYLDAVFYPNIYQRPQILMQEGWHYELDHKDADITYRGVVYSEMKGVFSSPEQVLFRAIQKSLFPDTTYGFESGGDPIAIPELTQEKFVEFHRKYYHPSNSYMFLYGDGDLLEQLKFLNDNYLKDFDKQEVDSDIKTQPPFSERTEMVVDYPILANENEKDKTFLSLNYVIDRSTNPEIAMAFDILEYLLLETPAAPLKKALIQRGLGKDVFGVFDASILQPTFSVIVKNSSPDRKNEFVHTVTDTLKNLVANGIDKKLIEGAINLYEFRLREADFGRRPKGLFYGTHAMTSWLYDASPYMHLQYDPVLAKIKTALTSDYFEKLIEQYLLKNPHSSLLVVKPQKGLAEVREQSIRKKLAEFKGKLSETEINQLIESTQKLRRLQAEQDSPEKLAAIPLLSLEDIEKATEKLPLEERAVNGCTIFAHPMFTNHIAYVSLLFDTTAVPQELLPYLSLLARVLGKISTEQYGYEDISNEIHIHTGGIGFSTNIYTVLDSFEYMPKLVVSSRALVKKLPELFRLIGQLTGHTVFNEKNRLKEVIQEIKSRFELMITQSGHVIAITRARSYYSQSAKYDEISGGLSFYRFITDLEENFDARFSDISINLQKVSKLVFNKNNLLASVTISDDDYSEFERSFMTLEEHLGKEDLQYVKYDFELSVDNEGLITPGDVQYVAKAYNFRQQGREYTGTLQVLSTIVGLDYLWNRVRVQGGAYGCSIYFMRNGDMCLHSYRDPNLRETLKVYDELPQYIRQFNADDREMTKYIIGTISKLDTPLTPAMKGDRATAYRLSGLTYEKIQEERDQVLSTRQSDIQALADLVESVVKQDCLCVLGSESRIKENKDVFKNLIQVFD